MSLPKFSVQRPILTTMVTLIVVTLGLFSLSKLRIDMLPDVEMPRLTVRTQYSGADPEVMERRVTEPLEEIISTVPGVEELTSISSEGSSSVRVTFAWGTDIDSAAQDLRARLEDELDELPDDVTRPQIRTFDIASFPVVVLGIGSYLDPIELTDLLETQVRHRFARIPGVAQVDTWGGYNREIRVAIQFEKIRALELPLSTVLTAIRDSNLDLPAGSIEKGRYEIRLRAPAEFKTLEDIRSTVVVVRNGAPITIGQIAEVKNTYEKLSRIVRVNGELGLRVAIRKQANANTVEVSEAVLAEMERVNRDFSQIHIVPVINQGNFIERSITNVANSVLYGGGLAILVLLFFLRSIRSTLVIAVAIPISVVATFALIYLGGFTLNLMTLGGLALGVGMMVDSSIVVLENIFRRRDEYNESPAEASIRGASEVAAAIIASTITTLIIFVPLLFTGGIAGLLFRELAYVVGFSLICALLISLSLVPVLASKLVSATDDTAAVNSKWVAFATQTTAQIGDFYRRVLDKALDHRWKTVFVAVVISAASFGLFPLIGSEMMPPSDEGEVRVTGEMEIGTRLDLVDRQTRIIEEKVAAALPEARATITTVGSSGYRPDSGATGELRISLSPTTERTRSNSEIATDLRRRLSDQIPGMTVRTRAPQGQFILERVLGSAQDGVTVEVSGFDLVLLEKLAQRASVVMTGVPGVSDVDAIRRTGVPQASIVIDRAKASQLGISVRQISETLETAIAGRRSGEYRPEGDSYRILVQLEDAETRSIEEILDLTVMTATGNSVALRNMVTVEDSRGPSLIDRKNQQRMISVTANVAGRDLGSVATEIETQLAKIPRPLGYDVRVAGALESQREAFGELVTGLILALFLVYMVLACQYESLRDPLVVMFSVPVAGTGVLLTLWLTDNTLNIQSYIGCIMLGGIVVNNAILLVDQSSQLRAQGLTIREAVAEAGRRRLRPILMTTSTTILGLLPLALGIGEGAETQAPMALAVIGGLTASTMITLILIPVVHSLLMHRN